MSTTPVDNSIPAKLLAIIIPAYKAKYLQKVLDCLAAQYVQDFTVYVGDDCSPYGLQAMVEPYLDKMDIRYTRFDTNLGSHDLIGQWERCVALAGDEPWLWLFSDDDMMDPACVGLFKTMQQSYPDARLFHFDVTVIEADGKPTTDPHFIKPAFPLNLSANDFLRQRLEYQINSFAVEYIVERRLFEQTGGFVRYPLAWCSDDATWHRLAKAADGILSLPLGHVYWRKSDSNITTDSSRAIQRQKLLAVCKFLRYCLGQLGHSSLPAVTRYFLHALYQARSIFGL